MSKKKKGHEAKECRMKKILVDGAGGQIGSELVLLLREMYGKENVIASDKQEPTQELKDSGVFEFLDVCDKTRFEEVLKTHEIDTVFHLAAILSANGEKVPQRCWEVNINGLINLFQLAISLKLKKIIVPSSIAAFGPDTPDINTPNDTILRPTSMYGVTKVCGERLGDYYVQKFGIDIRGIRLPGIISSKTLPGGGTTDYAVEIFYEAIKNGHYKCFVEKDTKLPMMYMPDCLSSFIQLANAPFENLKHHCDFNVTAMSFSVEELALEIQKHIPHFTIEYAPDYRQKIANSWPKSIDDSSARQEWGWNPKYDLAKMTEDMLMKLRKKLTVSCA